MNKIPFKDWIAAGSLILIIMAAGLGLADVAVVALVVFALSAIALMRDPEL